MKRAQLFVVSAAALLFAACSNGNTVNPVTPVQVLPTASPTPPTVQSTSVQRTEANQALQTAQFANSGGTIAGVPLLSVAKRPEAQVRQPARGTYAESDLTFGSCTQSGSNYEETASAYAGTGSVYDSQYAVRMFYDAECGMLAQDSYSHIVSDSSNYTGTITGTVQQYDRSHAQVSYATVTGTLNAIMPPSPAPSATPSGIQISIKEVQAPSPSASPIATTGFACTIMTGSGTLSLLPSACGMGSVVHAQAASKDYGATMSMSFSESGTLPNLTVTQSGTATTYTGALNALTLAQGTFPAWTITGGQAGASATYTTNGQTITFTDSTSDATVTVTWSATGENGTVKQISTGKTMATFVTDQFGNGTVTYSDGSKGNIVDFAVVS